MLAVNQMPPAIPTSLGQSTTRAAKACFGPCTRPHHQQLACRSSKRFIMCMQSVKSAHAVLHVHCSSVTPRDVFSSCWCPPCCCQRHQPCGEQHLLLPTYPTSYPPHTSPSTCNLPTSQSQAPFHWSQIPRYAATGGVAQACFYGAQALAKPYLYMSRATLKKWLC